MTLDTTPAANPPTDHQPCSIGGDGFTTTAMWFGPAERPLAGWWTAPARPSRDGVVIAAPLGYEYWSTHRSLRTLAEALARAGWNVLRFDWDGTGDSAGDATDPDRVAAWRASLAHAVTAMRAADVERVALVGLRLGATLSLLDAAALDVDDVVACTPVAGKRFVKELKMLGIANPERPGDVLYSGLVITPDTAAELAAIDPEQAVSGGGRTLLVSRTASEGAKLAAKLSSDQRCVEVCECPQMQSMLDKTAEDATVPEDLIESVLDWLGKGRSGDIVRTASMRPDVVMPCRGGRVRETFTLVDNLVTVCSAPLAQDSDTVVVFLNSGAEPHIGPARAWVEYARSLACHGFVCVRTDFSGWGESPDEGHPPGRPYDPHCILDTLRLVSTLSRKYRRVILAGLCAGAWAGLKAAQQTRVDGVFALNPQLYWQSGDPVEALMADTHRRRIPNRRCEALGARWRYWSLLDLLGIRPMASRWLISLRKRQTRIMLSFAEGDDGLTFLRDRCGRRITTELRSGHIMVEEVSGIDHQMYRLWRRPAIIEQMLRFLDNLPAATSVDSG